MSVNISGLFQKLEIDSPKLKISTISTEIPPGYREQFFIALDPIRTRIHISPNRPTLEEPQPAYLGYNLPPSHILEFHQPIIQQSHDDIVNNPTFFMTQVLSLLTSFYVLPNSFNYFEVRIPFRQRSTTFFHPPKQQLSELLDLSLTKWENSNQTQREILINALWSYTRSRCKALEFERFSALYPIIDLMFKYHWTFNAGTFRPIMSMQDRGQRLVHKVSHGNRLTYLCSFLNITLLNDLGNKIKDSRNNLEHELLWDSPVILSGNDFTDDSWAEKIKVTNALEELIGVMLMKTLRKEYSKNHIINDSTWGLVELF